MHIDYGNNIQDIPACWKAGKIQYGYMEKHYYRPSVM